MIISKPTSAACVDTMRGWIGHTMRGWIVRKIRCVGGRRHGRIVAKVAQCYAAPDPKKRARLKIMKARLGARLAKKTKRTKRTNPASIRLKQLNKRR